MFAQFLPCVLMVPKNFQKFCAVSTFFFFLSMTYRNIYICKADCPLSLAFARQLRVVAHSIRFVPIAAWRLSVSVLALSASLRSAALPKGEPTHIPESAPASREPQ